MSLQQQVDANSAKLNDVKRPNDITIVNQLPIGSKALIIDPIGTSGEIKGVDVSLLGSGTNTNQTEDTEVGIVTYEKDYVLNNNLKSIVLNTGIFKGGDIVDGVSVHTLRIPSMVILPNGNLFVTCEARLANQSDQTEANLYYSIIDGQTKEVLQNGFLVLPAPDFKISNPNSFVSDAGILYVFYSSFDAVGVINETNRVNNFFIKSTDNGLTFTQPVQILPNDQTADIKYMITPSKSIQLDTGEIIVPVWGKDFTNESGYTNPLVYRSGFLIFDSVTETFIRKFAPYTHLNEPVCYQDDAGNIVLDARVVGVDERRVYYTDDLGDTWQVHISYGRAASQVYTDLVRYKKNLLRCEIPSGLPSSARKDLDIYIGDINNQNYVFLSSITPLDQEIWGYSSIQKRGNGVLIVSEDKPDLNLYEFKVIKDTFNEFFTTSSPDPVTSYIYDLNPVGTDLATSPIVIGTDSPDIDTTQQTGAIIMTDVTTKSSGVVSEDLTTLGNYSEDITGVERFVYFKVTKNNDSFFQLLFDDGVTGNAGDKISIRTNNQDNNYLALRIIQNSTVTTDNIKAVGVSFNGSFKINLNNSVVTVYKWDGSQYVQHLSGAIDGNTYFIRLLRPVETVSGETTEINRIVVSSTDWVGETP